MSEYLKICRWISFVWLHSIRFDPIRFNWVELNWIRFTFAQFSSFENDLTRSFVRFIGMQIRFEVITLVGRSFSLSYGHSNHLFNCGNRLWAFREKNLTLCWLIAIEWGKKQTYVIPHPVQLVVELFPFYKQFHRQIPIYLMVFEEWIILNHMARISWTLKIPSGVTK